MLPKDGKLDGIEFVTEMQVILSARTDKIAR